MTVEGTQLDPAVLGRRLAAAARAAAVGRDVCDLRELSGGSSGLTFGATLVSVAGEQPVVIKVAPPGLPPVRNRDVLRQALVQRRLALEGSVPVPPVLFEDQGDPPDVPPLFAMGLVPGSSFEPLVDAADVLPPPDELRDRALDSARILGQLHRLDLDRLELGSEPPVGLAAEIDRWERMLQSSGMDLGALPERCTSVLRRTMPEPVPATLVHGDYRLGNQICDRGRVRAVLDWEIWSVSDPRIDLGWFLMTVEPDGLPSAVRSTAPGLPRRPEVLAEYEAVVGAPVGDLPWFSALARLRSAAAMSLNVKHNRRRPVPSPRIESYAGILPDYLRVALDLLGG